MLSIIYHQPYLDFSRRPLARSSAFATSRSLNSSLLTRSIAFQATRDIPSIASSRHPSQCLYVCVCVRARVWVCVCVCVCVFIISQARSLHRFDPLPLTIFRKNMSEVWVDCRRWTNFSETRSTTFAEFKIPKTICDKYVTAWSELSAVIFNPFAENIGGP